MKKKISAVMGVVPAFAGEINDTFQDLGAGTGALLTSLVGPVLLFVVGISIGVAIADMLKGVLSGAKLKR